MTIRSVVALSLLGAGMAPCAWGQAVHPSAFQLSEKHIAEAAEGAVVVRRLKADDPREVAIVAAVLLPELRVESAVLAGELERLATDLEELQFGRLRPGMLTEDLQALAIPAEDFRLIPRCEVGKCKIKLPADVLDTLTGLDWTSKESAVLANAYLRAWFESYLEGYWAHGDSALAVYVDKESPAALASGMEHILEHSAPLEDGAPALYRFLQASNRASDAIESSFHWTIRESELRPVTTLNHSVRYDQVEGEQTMSWLATKLLYASHYYLAGLKVWYVASDVPELPTGRVLLIHTERSVFDDALGGVKRTLLEHRMQQDLRERIASLRDSIDRAYGLNGTAEVGQNP